MNQKNQTKILIVAGGTGGHISPGIALYQEFQDQKISCIFVSLKKNKNYSEFIKKNIKIFLINAPRISTAIKDLILFFPLLISGILQSLKIILINKANIIIGMGGYSSVPVLIAGILLNKKIYLCEQNVLPGRVTLIFSKFAKKIFLTFPLAQDMKTKISNKEKWILVGPSYRKEIFEFAIKHRKKNTRVKKIFLTGGSQGALQLNEMILDLFEKYPEFCKKFEWFIQTGEAHLNNFQARIENISFKNKIFAFGFSTNIYEYFSKADLLICRAGSGILSEGILFCLPMILIPYPYAKDNHQLKNAEFIEKNQFGILLNTKEKNSEPLYKALELLLKNYKIYKTNLEKEIYKSNPTKKIKEIILEDK